MRPPISSSAIGVSGMAAQMACQSGRSSTGPMVTMSVTPGMALRFAATSRAVSAIASDISTTFAPLSLTI